jgi:CemA family
MKNSMFGGFSHYWQQVNEWFFRTADRALDEAYKAALKIKAIEDEHFGGQKISFPPNSPSNSITTYFQADLTKYLNIARLRLAEFQTSRTINPNTLDEPANDSGITSINPYISDIEAEARILEKLQFIDQILDRYSDDRASDLVMNPAVMSNSNITPANPAVLRSFNLAPPPAKKTNVLIDRSIVNTFAKIRQDLNPQAEQEVVNTFRSSKSRTRDALRFVLTLTIAPLLVHFVLKLVFFGPIIDIYYPPTHRSNIFINQNLEKEALEELEQFERHLKFQMITGLAPEISAKEIEGKVKEKAEEIRTSFTYKSTNAIKNWFADAASIVAFSLIITKSKRQLANLMEFIDSIVSGVSDTAKAFIIILLTDTFVGFHSPHGWEVLLEGLAEHLGIPESRSFNSLFIATFPVLLDTIFKYWIFRYLSGQSPSAVATFKTMNE